MDYGGIIAVLAGAAVTSLIGWVTVIRRFSGKIGSSDAEQLWMESRSIRDWSQARIAELTAENRDLWKFNADLQKQVAECGRTVATLNRHISELKGSE